MAGQHTCNTVDISSRLARSVALASFAILMLAVAFAIRCKV